MECLFSLEGIAQFIVAAAHDPVSVAPLVLPCGAGELQVVVASVNRFLPAAMEAQLTGIVEGVARALRIFFYGKLQKIHVLSPAFRRVRLMDGDEEVGLRPLLFNPPVRYRIFVAWVVPMISMSGVNFFIVEADSASPIEHVAKAGGLSLDPDTLNLLAPTRLA